MNRKYYKVLMNGQSFHGGAFQWSLPTKDGPGEWHRHAGEVRLCESGFHLTWAPAHWWKAGCSVFEAEIEELGGEEESDRKIVCRGARLVREVTDHAELATLGIFYSGAHALTEGKGVAYGSASVRAYGSASVVAYGSASVEAYDSASVRAYGSASVVAYGSASVEAYGSASVEAYGSASVVAKAQVTIVVFWGDPKLQISDGAVVVDRRGSRPKVTIADEAVAP